MNESAAVLNIDGVLLVGLASGLVAATEGRPRRWSPSSIDASTSASGRRRSRAGIVVAAGLATTRSSKDASILASNRGSPGGSDGVGWGPFRPAGGCCYRYGASSWRRHSGVLEATGAPGQIDTYTYALVPEDEDQVSVRK